MRQPILTPTLTAPVKIDSFDVAVYRAHSVEISKIYDTIDKMKIRFLHSGFVKTFGEQNEFRRIYNGDETKQSIPDAVRYYETALRSIGNIEGRPS